MENLDISRHSPKHGFHLIHLNYFSMTCLPKNEKLSDCNYQRYTNQQLLAAIMQLGKDCHLIPIFLRFSTSWKSVCKFILQLFREFNIHFKYHCYNRLNVCPLGYPVPFNYNYKVIYSTWETFDICCRIPLNHARPHYPKCTSSHNYNGNFRSINV